jgi:hypothetical protein
MTVKIINMTNNRNQESVPWIERLGTISLTPSVVCQKVGAVYHGNIIIIELRRFGSRKRIIYCAKRT